MPKLLFIYLKSVTQNLEILPVVQNLKSSQTLYTSSVHSPNSEEYSGKKKGKNQTLLPNIVFSSKENMSTNSVTWNNFNIFSNSEKTSLFWNLISHWNAETTHWNQSAPSEKETREEWVVTCLKNRWNKDILKVLCLQALSITRRSIPPSKKKGVMLGQSLPSLWSSINTYEVEHKLLSSICKLVSVGIFNYLCIEYFLSWKTNNLFSHFWSLFIKEGIIHLMKRVTELGNTIKILSFYLIILSHNLYLYCSFFKP